MKSIVDKVREKNPLIHNIANQVVANDVANALLAIGASPMMAYEIKEMEDVAKIADAVVLNTGTLTENMVESIIRVGQAANRLGKPVVLDPVGVGATRFRQDSVALILEKVEVQLIRGNAGELAQLAGVAWKSKGVDAGEGDASIMEIARTVAQKHQTVVFISGEKDVVSDSKRTAYIQNGHPLMTKITGTGCMLSGICGAFLAVGDDIFNSTVSAGAAYAIAGELAVEEMDVFGPGYFRPTFMNALYNISDASIQERMDIQEDDKIE